MLRRCLTALLKHTFEKDDYGAVLNSSTATLIGTSTDNSLQDDSVRKLAPISIRFR